MQRPRPASMDARQSQFQAQASRFFHKLSNFTFRRKSGSNAQDPYQFSTRGSRSMDLNHKPFMSQPTLGLHLSQVDSSPNEGSSRSPSPNPSSLARNGNPVLSTPIIEITPSDDGPTSTPTSMPPRTSSTLPKGPRPLSSSAVRSGSRMSSPPSSRSISFDVSREILPQNPPAPLPAGKSPNRRSFDIRRTLFNKSTPSPTPSTNIPSTPPNAGQQDLSVRNKGWASSVDVSGAPKIEGLPAISPADSTSFRWSYIQQNIRTDDTSLSVIREHAATPDPPDVLSHNPSNNTPSSAAQSKPPVYDQVANWPPGQVDSATPRNDTLLRLSSLPPSVFIMEGGSARLSPTVMTRHPPLPLMSLPTLSAPPPIPPPPSSGIPSRVRLRHMPSLFMEGSDDEMSEHEIENSDEEYDDHDVDDEAGEQTATPTSPGSDDEDTTLEIEVPPAVAGPSSRTPQASPSNIRSPSMNLRSGDTTPTAGAGNDYFSPIISPLTPLEWDPELKRRMAILGSPGASVRGMTIHRRASKSMVDLLHIKNTEMPVIEEEGKGKGKAKDTGDQSVDDANDPVRPRPRRQRSLPMFQESSDPPPYPEFEKNRPLFKIQPREEEGMENLPAYSNSIYLAAILPRKVEFTAPGVQAKDRKWRRSLCILEGTAFKVYKPPPGTTGVSTIGSWWERAVGVGDLTSTASVPSAKRLSRSVKVEGEPGASPPMFNINQDIFPPVSKKKIPIAPSFLSRSSNNSGSSSGRRSMDSPLEERGTRSRRSFSIPRPILNGNSGSRSQSTSRLSFDAVRSFSYQRSQDPEERPSDQKELICVYSLQRAESGLASDYLKRKNVIRIRMEGQQFLLQAPSVPAVVEWIEGFQAAANVALDLEDRPMPKGPVFPRRRRRRLRPPEVSESTPVLQPT